MRHCIFIFVIRVSISGLIPHPSAQLSTRPICKVPALAIANGDAVDTVGYRNYLGANVVGRGKMAS